MPEQLTKHPEVTLRVLQSGGARCGDGAPQAILTACPAERFCALPGGEICVYGLGDAAGMTQLSAADWQALAAITVPATPPPPAPPPAPPPPAGIGLGLAIGVLAGVLVGLLAAWVMARRRRGAAG